MTLGQEKIKLLIVDDERDAVYSFRRLFEREYQILEAFSGEQAIELVKLHEPEVVVMDVRMKGMTGVEALAEIRRIAPRTVVILVTAYGTTQSTIEAMKLGAFEYLLKPFDVQAMRDVVARAARAAMDMRRTVGFSLEGVAAPTEDEIVGLSPPMQEVYKLIGRVADSDLPVLITGESGTGKELVARALYQHSRRRDRPFLAINCAAIPEQLLESELFGYERGAFTGASVAKPGKFEVCDGGTIFLDEIGEMPLATQKKLLRVLETGEIEKVGSTRPSRVDVRVIAATNRNLEELIEQEQFRTDLYFRLRVVEIRMPPLRERLLDIPALAQYFVRKVAQELHREPPVIAPEAIALLQSYHWPGNVRELENLIKNCMIVHPGHVIRAADLETLLGKNASPPSLGMPPTDQAVVQSEHEEALLPETLMRPIFERLQSIRPLPQGWDAFDVIEKQLLEMALRECHGNKSKAARLLGISRNTVRKRVEKYGLHHIASEDE